MTEQQSTPNPVHQLYLEFALQAAELGVWDYYPATRLVNWDGRAQALFGISDSHSMPYEQAIEHIHLQDKQRVDQAVTWAVNPLSDGVFDQTYRTLGVDDAQLRWVRFICSKSEGLDIVTPL